MESSSSVMAPFFANQSCDPFQPKERPCELGNYVRYAVDATGAGDIAAAVRFARARNIRLVIRNTGHDYLGRSTGAGALAVWTHHLKSVGVVDYAGPHYRGKALRVGAGVQGYEVMQAAHRAGLAVVGGECPTVGIAGGYTQGGGHSALSSSFGLSADNVLEWEVVTADGRLVTASRTRNADLYWALSGGGPGNWGVVVSMTTKAHPDAKFGGATLIFTRADNDETVFFNAIDAFHGELATMVDAGSMVVYYFASTFFQIAPINAYNKTAAEVRESMKGFVTKIDALGLKYTVNYTETSSYIEHYDRYFGPLPLGNIQVGIAQYGGRLVPRRNIKAMGPTVRSIAGKGAIWIGVGTNVAPFAPRTAPGGPAANAVLPAWRDAIAHVTLTTPWSFTAPWADMLALQDLMTNVLVPEIEAATPGSGAYMNEADFRQPNFQQAFFGSNYARLKEVKRKWDANRVFYVPKGVLSEEWTVQNDGRLCRV
jgi:hypothetical protein